MENPKKYVLNNDMIEKIKYSYENLTFEETKEVFGKAGESDAEHFIRMHWIEADLSFVKMVREFLGEKEFTLPKLSLELGKLFNWYETRRDEKSPIQLANEAIEAMGRCAKSGMFKEVV